MATRAEKEEKLRQLKIIRLEELKRLRADIAAGAGEAPVSPGVALPSGVGPIVPEGRPAPTPEELKERVLSLGDLPIGAIIGGTAGGILGTAGGPAGSVAGGTLGAAGGEAVEQHVRRTFGLGGVPETSAEAAKEILLQGGLGALGEVGGQALIRGGAFVGSKLAPVLRPGVKEAVEAVQPAFGEAPTLRRSKWNPFRSLFKGEKQQVLTPASATESITLDNLEAIAEQSFFGGGRIIRAKELTDDVITKLVDDFAEGLRGPAAAGLKTEVGDLIFDAVRGGSDAFSAAGRGMYAQVDNLIGTAKVNIRPMKRTAERLLSEAEEGLLGTERVTLLTEFLKKADDIPFAQAQTIRSDLLASARPGGELTGTQAQGVAKLLAKQTDNAMENSISGISPAAVQAYRNANKFWKEGKAVFNSGFIKGLIKSDPSVAVNKILQADRPGQIHLLRKAVDDPEVWKKIQGTFVDKMIKAGVSDEVTQHLSGSKLLRAIRTHGPEMLQALAPKGELKPLQQFAKALALSQARQPGGKGARVIIALGQAGALGKVAWTGDPDAASVAILVGPFGIARMLTNPAVNRVIMDGFKIGGGTQALASFGSRLGGVLTEQGIDAKVQFGVEAEAPIPLEPIPFELPAGIPALPGAI